MQRRTLILGIGVAAAGGAVGTGAFTSVTADRDVSVDVAGDADAFLSLSALDNPGNGEYAGADDDGSFFIDLTSTDAGGSGLNLDGVTAIDEVFQVRNQGTQSIDLTLVPDTPEADGSDISGAPLVLDQDDLEAVPDGSDQNVLLGVVPQEEVPTDSITLEPGDDVTYGLVAVVSSDVNKSDAIDADEVVFTAEVSE